MLLVLEIVLAIFLEKKARKNSSNSGLPPSRNDGSNGNRNKGSGDRADLGQAASNVQHTETSEDNAAGSEKGKPKISFFG
jgi:hypothetical protein